MAIEIHLPDIGADSADVTEILVNVGDAIEVDSPLISVEGDKAAMEVPSPNAGTVTEIMISVTVPALGEGTSMAALSPSTLMRGESTSIASPTLTRISVTSAESAPISGK